MRKLKTSTKHHHSFASNIEPDIHFLFTPANTTRFSHGFKSRQKSTGKIQTEGYLYCLLRKKDALKTCRCDKRQCKAIATTFEDNVFTTKEHLHEPDMKHSEQLKVLEKMKEKTANSNEQPRKIVQDTTATITREYAVALPKYKSLARSIQSQRGWGNKPTTLKDVAIPSELQLTLRGENFLAHDSGISSKMREMVTRRPITTLKAGIEPSN